MALSGPPLVNPPHYVTSEDYQPGLMNQVGTQAFAVLIIVLFFIFLIVGSRILLRRSRRLSPGMRRILRLLGGLSKPAAPISVRDRRRDKLGSRRKSETHYRMSPALAPEGGRSMPLSTTAPERVERPLPRKRGARDFSLAPEEAWPFYDEDEVAAVVSVLNSGKVNQWTGSKVFEFEKTYAGYLRNGRAIALTNGSVALELALRAFGIGPGDDVVVTPRTFVASAFCVRLVGAKIGRAHV